MTDGLGRGRGAADLSRRRLVRIRYRLPTGAGGRTRAATLCVVVGVVRAVVPLAVDVARAARRARQYQQHSEAAHDSAPVMVLVPKWAGSTSNAFKTVDIKVLFDAPLASMTA